MNVLQLIPNLNVGGVEKGTIEVAGYLALNGHKAVVISGGGIMEKSIAAIGARHYKLPIGRKNPFIMAYCFFKVKNIIRKENINIVHARSRVPALIGYFAARVTGRVFITTAHGQYKKHIISRVMGWGKSVIVANATMARYMKENFDVSTKKIRIIPRGVDLDKFSFISPIERKSKVFRIGMICRYTELKGHLDFIKAVSYVHRKRQNVEVVIMGDKSSAKEEYIKKLEMTTRRLMVDSIVQLKDSDKEVSEVLKTLDVFVSANREQEAFGRSIIEAQARGVPVVATRVGGTVENIIDGKTGLLCEPMNPSDMAAKILRYSDDVKLRERIARDARKHVEERYSLDSVMKMTLEEYSRVLSAKNILIIKISSLGDVILCVPSLRAVRKRFPTAVIKVLVDVRFREVLDNCPYVDEIITCDLNYRDKGVGFFRLAAKLRSEDFDISIDFQNSKKSHMLSFLSATKERYGYNNGKLSFLINRKAPIPKKAVDPVTHQFRVLGLLGITSASKILELWPNDDSEAWVENFFNTNWLKKNQKVIALSLSASQKWKTKNWNLASMVKLTENLAVQKGIRTILIGLKDDKEYAQEFLRKTNAKPVNAVGKTNISQLVSLIKRCNAVLTGDSAPMHIAAATKTPFVAIFGPTDPDRHLVPTEQYEVIHKKLRCSPCYSATCMRNMKCMNLVKPEEVLNSLLKVMGTD